MREPLPLYCKTSAAYAAAKPARRRHKARDEWESDRAGPDWIVEGRQPEHQLVLGGAVPFDQLLHDPPAAGEDGDGWAADETSRFGRLARRLWDGLLAVERLENL